MKRVGLFVAEAKQDPDKFVCPHCGKEYKTEDGLLKHCQEKHPEAFDDKE